MAEKVMLKHIIKLNKVIISDIEATTDILEKENKN